MQILTWADYTNPPHLQVAALSGRAVLWPDVPCNASWLTMPQRAAVQAAGRMLDLEPSHRYGPPGDERCYTLVTGDTHCLRGGRGMTQAEFG